MAELVLSKQSGALSAEDNEDDGGLSEENSPSTGAIRGLLPLSGSNHHQGFKVGAEHNGPPGKTPKEAFFPPAVKEVQVAEGHDGSVSHGHH